MSYTDFLALVIADEIARREHKKFNFRIRHAGLGSVAWSTRLEAS